MTTKPADSSRPRPFHLKLASAIRWLHTYLSMLSLVLILFFSITGLTLNHPDWFVSQQPRMKDSTGTFPVAWVTGSRRDDPAVLKLEIVEALRKQGARGAVEEFRIDESECMVSFKAPGYSSDTFIERNDGTYRMTTSEEGTVAVLNDLHKGRHSGAVWSVVVDASAILLTLISVTGLGLIFFLKRIRIAALLTVGAGIALVWILIRMFVPH